MTANTSAQNPLLTDEYMSEPAVVAFLGVSTRTLARRNAERQGPPQIRFGKKVFYRRTSIIDWLNSCEQHQPRARARR
jgi:predicted DNA-binding transcriptional regulator AlpA